MRGLLALGGLVAALSLSPDASARDCDSLVIPDSEDGATNITLYECGDGVIDRVKFTLKRKQYLVEQIPADSTQWGRRLIADDPADPYFSFVVYIKRGKNWRVTDQVMRVYPFQQAWDATHPR
jgi:hypothetical protein